MAGKADRDPSPKPRGLFPRLRDTRIRSKLGLILIVPLIATIAFAALRLVDSAHQLVEAETVQSLAAVSARASTVAHQLHQERLEAIGLLAEPDPQGAAYGTSVSRTDAAIETYQRARAGLGDVPQAVAARLAVVDEHLATVATLRDAVTGQRPVAASAALLRYGAIGADILAYQESVAAVVTDPGLSEQARAVAAWGKALVHAGEAAAIATLAAAGGQPSGEQLPAFLATQTGQQEAFLAFGQSATPAQQAVADQAIAGGSVDYRALTSARAPGGELASTARALAGTVDAARWAERRLHDQLLQAATAHRDDVFAQVLRESAGVLLALATALTLALLLARALARSLGRLREHALQVADRELPATVERMADPATLGQNTPAQLAAQVREPAILRSRDEIGQVAQSFAVVHRAAVRVAAEQAALRTSVAAMFLNLARRSQSLVDRMISQLDDIERSEEDPKRLSRLFQLDHLATRMRRNDENLLTLAGADSGPPRGDDALVVDVLRAAQSEVESYDRIEFGAVDDDVWVLAGAVNDVVRLLAELFDNATRFSSPQSPVFCEARRVRDQVIVQVEDRGVGMPPDQVERVNTWIARPPEVEVATFRKMGLAVVSRLAHRHRMHVQLRCDPDGGTVVYVALPRNILVLPAPLRSGDSRLRAELPPAPAAPAAPAPLPVRHLGQAPQRSPDVVRHAANRRAHDEVPTWPGPADVPVAGRPIYELTTRAAPAPAAPSLPAPAPAPAAESHSTVELPIFKEMEAVWFRSHGQQEPGLHAQMPRAGGYPAPPATPAAAPRPVAPPLAPASTPAAATAAVPGQRSGHDPQPWHTAADGGWQLAAAAATPTAAGATSSGLPRRVPQAQLVPGSVPAQDRSSVRPPGQRRSPEEVRGLLAAYHRGVQRGRETNAQ